MIALILVFLGLSALQQILTAKFATDNRQKGSNEQKFYVRKGTTVSKIISFRWHLRKQCRVFFWELVDPLDDSFDPWSSWVVFPIKLWVHSREELLLWATFTFGQYFLWEEQSHRHFSEECYSFWKEQSEKEHSFWIGDKFGLYLAYRASSSKLVIEEVRIITTFAERVF